MLEGLLVILAALDAGWGSLVNLHNSFPEINHH